MRWRLDLRLDREQFGEALGRAGRLRELAPYLTKLTEPARGEHRIEDELPERAGCGPPCEHILRADPQDHDDAAEHEEEDDRGQDRTGARRWPRRLECALDRTGEARLCELFVRVGLQRADRTNQFGGISRGFGQRVLRGA